MNLVIDDAIEVTLARKETPEERRKLGEWIRTAVHLYRPLWLTESRPSPPQRRQHLANTTNQQLSRRHPEPI